MVNIFNYITEEQFIEGVLGASAFVLFIVYIIQIFIKICFLIEKPCFHYMLLQCIVI